MMRLIVLVQLLFVALVVPLPAAAQGQSGLPTSSLTIETEGGPRKFTVELADTDERRSVGLMHRNAMPADAGMLFDFKRDQNVAMWMRNTRIPLDMLFIARDGRIANIAERAVPFSETTLASKGQVRAVLELNGGTAARLGIKPGDRVIHPVFHNAN